MDSPITIRRYQPPDRDGLFRIAADTAFFGEPVEVFMEDRRIFLDSFFAYYTDYEPENSWVASNESGMIGFLTGCVDTQRQREITAKKLEPKALKKLISGKYRPGIKTWRYLCSYFTSRFRNEDPFVDLNLYPAHFHINLDSNWRGGGIGKRLIRAFIEDLKLKGCPGVHLQTTSYHKIACGLYEKMGFVLLDSRPTRLWKSYLFEPIDNRAYGMRL
jgi:ribosomal protein S18 acetylase RimI-like enzyme